MRETTISITATDNRSFDSYLVDTEQNRRAIIVVQEIFGVNENMRQTAAWLGKEGFTACVPDLFWRLQPGTDLDPAKGDDQKKAMELNKAFDQTKGVEDLKVTLRYLRAKYDQVGIIGFCLGGRMAYLMAAQSDVDCAICYYGVAIDKILNHAPNITNPLMLHIAKEDHLCPTEAQTSIHAALATTNNVTLHFYPDVGHAFARRGSPTFDASKAAIANERSLQFLNEHLGPRA